MLKVIFISILCFLSVEAKELQKVSVQLEWKHQFEFAGFYAAIERGYYEDIGLEVELIEYESHMDVSKKVVSQEAEFGIFSSQLILERLRGEPIVLLASYFKQNALALVTQPSIKSPADLRGKKIMGVEREINYTTIGAMLDEFGIMRNDFELIDHEYSVDAFASGKIDAMSIFVTAQPYELDQKNVQYNILNPAQYGLYSYDVELFTSETFALHNPKLVADFVKATNRGWEYAFEHQEEIVDLIYDKYTQRKSKEALLYEAKQTRQIFKLGTYQLGSVAPELVKLNIDMYEKLGIVDTDYDIKELLNLYIFDYEKYAKMLQLSKKEKEFLATHQKVKLHIEKDYNPFIFVEDGKVTGYVKELLDILSDRLGIEFVYEYEKSWNEAVAGLKNKELDAISLMVPQPERYEYALFTAPLIQNNFGIVTKSSKQVESLNDLTGKTVGVVKGYIYDDIISRYYPQIQLQYYDNNLQGLQDVSHAKIDAFVSTDMVNRYLIGKHTLFGLQSFKLDSNTMLFSTENMAIRKDWGIFVAILDKTLASIEKSKLFTLQKRWLNLAKEHDISKVTLTKEQKEYIQNNPTIRVHNESDWAPYNYEQDGIAMGLSIDYIRLIAAKAGLNVEFVTGHTWDEYMQMLEDETIDVMLNTAQTPQRNKKFAFTNPYMQTVSTLFTHEDFEKYKSLSDYNGKKIVVIRGFYQEELLQKHYPNIELVLVDNVAQSLEALSNKKADAALGSYGMYLYNMKQYGYDDIVVNEFIDDAMFHIDLALATNKNNMVLRDILEKARADISYEEYIKLQQKWLDYDTHKTKLYSDTLLTQEQMQYLSKKRQIKMCVDPQWMPYESYEDGQHRGMAADFFEIFKQHLNVDITIVPTKNWTQSLQYAKDRRCDIISLAMQTPDRSEYLNFTSPYISVPLVLATKSEVTFVDDFEKLQGRRLAIVKDYAFTEILEKKYPLLQLIEVDSVYEGLEGVSDGDYFGFIGSLADVGYAFQQTFSSDLKIAGRFDEKWELGIGVRNDDIQLLEIFEKIVQDLQPEKAQSIFNKWVAIKYEKGVDYTLAWQVIVVSLIILLAIVYWNRRLQGLNKQLEAAKLKAEEATRAKSAFLANMSHEIRTPMNAIIGLLYLLKQTRLEQKQQDYIHKIEKSSKSLLHIINDILDFSKIEARKVTLEMIEFDLEDIVEDIKDYMELKAKQKGLQCSLEIDKNVNTKVVGDPYRISQVLLNLLSNAIKFTHEGYVKVQIRQHKKRYCFVISDSGIGLSTLQQQSLFDSFTQADGSTTRNYGGTGLGLSISKELAKMMDGDIEVWSRLDKGSSFTFCLKLQNHTNETKAQNLHIDPQNTALLEGIKILLVEDNSTNQEIIQGLLQQYNAEVVIANDGEEAVELYLSNKEQYALILMDIQMPKMDGYEAAKRIRQEDKTVPIIALSANVLESEIAKTKAAGMDYHITKPIDVERFFDTLVNYIDLKITDPKKVDTPILEQFRTIDNRQLVHNLKEQALIEKVLHNFYENYAQLQLEKLEKEHLPKAVHTLKGLSGNIAALDLYRVAQLYERGEATLQQLQQELESVTQELGQKLPQQKSTAKWEQLSSQEIEQLFSQLHEAIKTRRPNRWEPIVARLQHVQLEPNKLQMFQKIEDCLKKYRFKEALELF
ncbi:MAG: transporter substrate-binding domain-containing protein [Campylobacterota bacterium]